MNKHLHQFQHVLANTLLCWGAIGLGFLSGCSTPPPTVKPVTPVTPLPPVAKVPEVLSTPPGVTSLARNNKEYRKDAASHLYGMHAQRIYKGRMPPLLEAVGVLNVDIDQKGAVKSVNWMRAPKHAPQVMAEIERMVKSAAPYPVPKHLSQVTYTDTWLWHKSGQFQLDTLTEGQD
jgi:protein TonB